MRMASSSERGFLKKLTHEELLELEQEHGAEEEAREEETRTERRTPRKLTVRA